MCMSCELCDLRTEARAVTAAEAAAGDACCRSGTIVRILILEARVCNAESGPTKRTLCLRPRPAPSCSLATLSLRFNSESGLVLPFWLGDGCFGGNVAAMSAE